MATFQARFLSIVAMMRFAVMAVAIILLGGAARPAQDLEPSGLWNAMVAAKGGRERLHGIQTFAMSLATKFPGFSRQDVAPGVVEEWVVGLPSRLWAWFDYRPGTMGYSVQVWNQPRRLSWVSRGAQVVEVGERQWAGQERHWLTELETLQAVYFLETAYVQPRPLSVRRQSGSTAEVEVSLPHHTAVYYTVDLTTHLVTAVRMTALVGDPPHPFVSADEFVFDGVTPIAGIQVPRRVRRGGAWGDATFTINPDLDPKIFETAPTGVTSKDDWRKWLRAQPQ